MILIKIVQGCFCPRPLSLVRYSPEITQAFHCHYSLTMNLCATFKQKKIDSMEVDKKNQCIQADRQTQMKRVKRLLRMHFLP